MTERPESPTPESPTPDSPLPESPLPDSPATAALDRAGVRYGIRHHGRVDSAEEAAAARGIPVGALAKSLVIRLSEGSYVIVLIPADRGLDYPKLRSVLGVRRLTMPSPDEAQQATGYARGTITPLGAGDWPVYVDQHLMAHDQISVGSGVREWAIQIASVDLVAVTNAQVAEIAEG